MGYPLGKAPTLNQDGTYTGTSPDEMQLIIGSRWATQGLVAGTPIKARADMSWDIAAHTAVVRTGAGLAVEAPVKAQQLAHPAAPASGSRQDWVCVDSDGNMLIRSGTQPTNVAPIAAMSVPAGATSTSQINFAKNYLYALPVQSSLGLVGEWIDSYGQDVPYDGPEWTAWQGTLPVFPTDRELELRIVQCISTARSSDPYKWDRGIYRHRIKIDGVQKFDFAAEYTDAWEPKIFTLPVQVLAGVAHTITYSQYYKWGSKPYRFVTGVPAGIQVWDKGAAK